MAEIIGFKPRDVEHIYFANKKGIGPISLSEINLYGESIEDVKKTIKFRKAPSDLEDIKDKFILFYNKICNECTAAAASGLTEALVSENINTRKTAVVIGLIEKLPAIDAENIILYGNCTYPYKDLGHHIPGCPPQANMILETIKNLNKIN